MVSVIMPAYNEGGHIYDNIATTRSILAEAGIEAEIVPVDDGSSDDTLAEIERAARDFPGVVVARNPYNMGKGMALRTGFDYSGGEIVVFLDADLDLHPSQIQRIIDELEAGPYDVVVTSKHHPDSQLDYPWFRKIASLVYYVMIKAMFGLPVRDTQTGLKVFRREVLVSVFHRLLVKKFAYDVELLAASVRFGYRVHEIPVALDFKRELKWGRIRFGDIFSIFVDTLAIFYRLRILRYYDIGRPLTIRDDKSVLVVVNGCPPPEDVARRLSVDSNTNIACIADEKPPSRSDIMFFSTAEKFDSWRESNGERYDFIGFLGAGYLPNGSWVKNAVRNFGDSDVFAVCGPIIPGPSDTLTGKAAAHVSSSLLTTGPDCYLRTLRRFGNVRKGSMDNVFFRSDYWRLPETEDKRLPVGNGWVFDESPGKIHLKYDPDVAVTGPIPPLFLSYLKMIARESFGKGRSLVAGHHDTNRWWYIVPMAIWVVIITGVLIGFSGIFTGFILCYMAVVVTAALLSFNFPAVPLIVAGVILDHLVRGFSYPAGMVAGFTGTGKETSSGRPGQ